jgi:hypothetical protein
MSSNNITAPNGSYADESDDWTGQFEVLKKCAENTE